MVRKAFFLLLLIAFWGIVFLPLMVESSGGAPLSIFPASSRPSDRLPDPWDGERGSAVQVREAGSGQGVTWPEPVAAGGCGSTYIIQRGDSLGTVAQSCGLSLADVLAANPQVRDPNRIYPGQQLNLVSGPARGGADTLPEVAAPSPTAAVYRAGAVLEVYARSLPPDTPVSIGIGLSGSGYHRLARERTDAEGNLFVTLTLPGDAQPGDEAFILITSQAVPAVQVISDSFQISP